MIFLKIQMIKNYENFGVLVQYRKYKKIRFLKEHHNEKLVKNIYLEKIK